MKRVFIFANRNKRNDLKTFDISDSYLPPDDGYVNAFGVSLTQLAPELQT